MLNVILNNCVITNSTSSHIENITARLARHKWSAAVDLPVCIFYLIASVVLSAVDIFCAKIILNESSLKKSPYFRIVLSITVSNIVQILFNSTAGGVFTLMGAYDQRWTFWVNSTSSAFLGLGWSACTAGTHLMALNRFVHVYWPEKIPVLFSHVRTTFYIICVWSIGLVWFGVLMHPLVNLLYNLDTYSFLYEKNSSSDIVLIAHTSFNVVNVIGMAIWYCLIYKKIRRQVQSMHDKNVSKDTRREMKILIQSVYLCSIVTITIITFNLCQYISMPWYCSFGANVIWLFGASSDALVLIFMN
uniref:Vomeronasal type-1 receptor n=1 Tax=Romanomermis culicivorax TaxID=13658 RepID=A0A915L5N8_ROMCU